MNSLTILLAVITLVSSTHAESWPKLPSAACEGGFMYNITMENLMTPASFNSSIPEDGLVYSPLVAISHSPRVSFASVRGYASPQLADIAKTGNNSAMLLLAHQLRESGAGVLGVSTVDALTLPGTSGTTTLPVDCNHPMVTVLSMIAPSPDWIIQVSNQVLVNRYFETHVFEEVVAGDLYAFDAGVDSGGDFIPPHDIGLHIPTTPPQNIVPLDEDRTDVFDGRAVGRYFIRRLG